MSNDRRKKQIRIRIEDTWVALWLPSLLLLAGSWWLWQRTAISHELVLDLWAERPGVVQLFVDEGNGFSEERSIRKELTEAEEVVSLRFDLKEFGPVVNLRLDPMDNDGYVVMHRLDYHQPGQWLAQSLLRPEYRIANSVRWQWNAVQRELAVYPAQGNQDPHFLLEGDFEFIRPIAVGAKRWGQHGASVLLGVVLGWLLRAQIVSVLASLWMAMLSLAGQVRRAQQGYTRWVDRLSIRWHLVNPTSCVLAGVLVGAYGFWIATDSDLMTKRDARLAPMLQFELAEGSTSRAYGYLRFGEEQRYHEFASFNTDPFTSGDRISIPLRDVGNPIRVVRIDPMEQAGVVQLRGLRLVYADGTQIPIAWHGWTARGNAVIEGVQDATMVIRSDGADPYVVSPEMQLSYTARSTLPAQWVFSIILGFAVTVALLLYNRLCTEELSLEQIRNLQRM